MGNSNKICVSWHVTASGGQEYVENLAILDESMEDAPNARPMLLFVVQGDKSAFMYVFHRSHPLEANLERLSTTIEALTGTPAPITEHGVLIDASLRLSAVDPRKGVTS